MLGTPKYKYGERVMFKIDDEIVEGTIHIIDEYGTFFNRDDVYYDIMSTDGREIPCLYKHIPERCIEPAVKN